MKAFSAIWTFKFCLRLIKPWLKEKTFGKNKRLMSLNRGPPTAKVRKPLYKEEKYWIHNTTSNQWFFNNYIQQHKHWSWDRVNGNSNSASSSECNNYTNSLNTQWINWLWTDRIFGYTPIKALKGLLDYPWCLQVKFEVNLSLQFTTDCPFYSFKSTTLLYNSNTSSVL